MVPIDPEATDYAAALNYAYDDHHMRELRVQRMTSGYSASASDAARTVRTVSRFTRSPCGADLVQVKSSQIVIAHKRRASAIFAADVTHKIGLTDGEPRLVEKVIRLIDSTEALNAIGFLL